MKRLSLSGVMRDIGEPDDAVREIRRRILGNKSVEPMDEDRNGEFFGKNNAGVRAFRAIVWRAGASLCG
jgi:hypothetical protein